MFTVVKFGENNFKRAFFKQFHSSQLRSLSTLKDFRFQDIEIKKRTVLKTLPDLNGSIPFGKYVSDHMLIIDWTADKGWEHPKIIPHQQILIEPTISALHYATQIFEGFKAFKTLDGSRVQLFRIEEHLERFKISADRLSLPVFDCDELKKCIIELIKIDHKWTPSKFGHSLYVRPFLFGTDSNLGIRQPNSAKLIVLTGPVGAYFSSDKIQPVSLYAEDKIVRAAPGGVGYAKTGGNYGHTIKVQADAFNKYGASQILWIYNGNLTEAGTMNVMVFWINAQTKKLELITPPLNGMILPGVTRKTILDIVNTWSDIDVIEREISLAEIIESNNQSRLLEVFGTGTACVISPINAIIYGQNESIVIPSTTTDDLCITKRIYKAITDIQYGIVDLSQIQTPSTAGYKKWVQNYVLCDP